MASYKVSSKQLAKMLVKLGLTDLEAVVDKAMLAAARRGRKLLMDRSPVGVTGIMRAGWMEPKKINGGYSVVNEAPHAPYVEWGTRPHMPPVDPLILWAKRVLGLSDREAKKAGWAIAIHISKHGTKPQYVSAGAESQMNRIVLEELTKAFAAAS